MDFGSTKDFHKVVWQHQWRHGLIEFTNGLCRLNTKLCARDLEVKDLVKDLSDGVSILSLTIRFAFEEPVLIVSKRFS